MYPNILLYKLCFWILALCVISDKLIPVYSETTEKPKTDETCESLRGHSGGKLNLLVVGLLKKSILLVTKDWVVYDTPLTSLNSTLHRLSLSNPVPMQTKYPKLWTDKQFQKTKPKVMDTMVMVDSNSELLCFVVFAPDYGVNYDLDSQTVSDGWQQVEREEEVFISTPEYKIFYATKKGSHGIKMALWEMTDDKTIKIKTDYGPICWVDKSKTIIIKKPDEKCGDNEPVEWPILKGFVADKTFYLFGEEAIHVFPFDTYGSEDARPVTDIEYADFFWCPGDTTGDTNSTKLGLLMAVIILLLVLLGLILFCANYVYQKQKKPGRRRKFNPIASMASIRSSGGSGAKVGILTKVFSSKPNSKASKTKSKTKKRNSSKKTGKTSSKRKTGRRKKSRSKVSKS